MIGDALSACVVIASPERDETISQRDSSLRLETGYFRLSLRGEAEAIWLGLVETGLGFQLVARAQDSLKVIIEPQR